MLHPTEMVMYTDIYWRICETFATAHGKTTNMLTLSICRNSASGQRVGTGDVAPSIICVAYCHHQPFGACAVELQNAVSSPSSSSAAAAAAASSSSSSSSSAAAAAAAASSSSSSSSSPPPSLCLNCNPYDVPGKSAAAPRREAVPRVLDWIRWKFLYSPRSPPWDRKARYPGSFQTKKSTLFSKNGSKKVNNMSFFGRFLR